MKVAVVLFNLGGPDQTKSIKPYLYNFFMDRNIIDLPLPLRWFVAQMISKRRGSGAALESYSQLGGKSPLLDNTRAQAQALEQKLGEGFKVFVSMRYWHPLGRDVAAEVEAYQPDEIILLPLYPQFSTTTSFSSLQDWRRHSKQRARTICCWPLNQDFILASADLVQKAYNQAPENTRLLFSAHGLPEKVIAKGDPYQWQCEQSAAAIAKAAGIKDWQICYQSRVGPMKWIGPSTDQALEQAATDKKGVLIYPHAFVSEHVETLVEIEQEYRQRAKELGIKYFARVETVMTNDLFISGLAKLVHARLQGAPLQRLCPHTFKRCGYNLMIEDQPA